MGKICHCHMSNVFDYLKTSNVLTMHYRRIKGDMIKMCKFVTGKNYPKCTLNSLLNGVISGVLVIAWFCTLL